MIPNTTTKSQRSKCQGKLPLVYVCADNSNLFIEGQKRAVERNPNFARTKPDLDSRFRINWTKTISAIVGGRRKGGEILVGSCLEDSKAQQSVWKKMQDQGLPFIKNERKFMRRETGVDVSLAMSMMQLIQQYPKSHSIHTVTQLVLVLVSGDADFLPILELATQNLWHVEVWGWATAISSSIRACPHINVCHLESLPKESFFIERFCKNLNQNAKKFSFILHGAKQSLLTESFALALEKILEWPCTMSWCHKSKAAIITMTYSFSVLGVDGPKTPDRPTLSEFQQAYQRLCRAQKMGQLSGINSVKSLCPLEPPGLGPASVHKFDQIAKSLPRASLFLEENELIPLCPIVPCLVTNNAFAFDARILFQ